MKKILTLVALVAATSVSFGQGSFNWGNSGTTLVSAGGTATPVVAATQFIFAVFFAPSTTVNAAGQASGQFLTAPALQTLGNYNTNTTAAGRVVTQTGRVEQSNTLPAGTTVDFIIRGWSANAGATWAQALASWNGGAVVANPGIVAMGGMYIGESVVGNNFVLGGGSIPNAGIVGAGANQVGGFNMQFFPVPEPSTLALAGLGAAALLFRRRK